MLEKTEWDGKLNMWDFYKKNWRPFGKLLTDMERKGVFVDTNYLKEIQLKAEALKVLGQNLCEEKVFLNSSCWHVFEGQSGRRFPFVGHFSVSRSNVIFRECGPLWVHYFLTSWLLTQQVYELCFYESKAAAFLCSFLGDQRGQENWTSSTFESDLFHMCFRFFLFFPLLVSTSGICSW